MSESKVYTIGYSGRTPEGVLAIMNELGGAVLVDVRFKPVSRFQPQWNGKSLANLLGPLYVPLPEFGNVNYKEGPIEIADYAAGVAKLRALGKPAVLMCVCKDAATCHRTTLAGMLRADGFEVEEVPAVGGASAPSKSKKPPKGRQAKLWSFFF
jgi:uncharacterized protein (DUF488 family)